MAFNARLYFNIHNILFSPQYSWNTSKVGIKHQWINQSYAIWKYVKLTHNKECLSWVIWEMIRIFNLLIVFSVMNVVLGFVRVLNNTHTTQWRNCVFLILLHFCFAFSIKICTCFYARLYFNIHNILFSPQYSWNTSKVGIKHQWINQSYAIWKYVKLTHNKECLSWVIWEMIRIFNLDYLTLKI
jgi:hypothetical protein